MTETPPCWRCGSDRARRRVLPPRRHTTHHDGCDCRVTYAQCWNILQCRRRQTHEAPV